MVLNYSHWVMLGSGTGVGNQVMTIATTSSSQLSDHRKGHVVNETTTTTQSFDGTKWQGVVDAANV